MPNEIPVVFQKVSNYDSHFIIKELTNDFEKKLDCLEKNTKYKAFLIPIEKKVIKIDTGGSDSVVSIS